MVIKVEHKKEGGNDRVQILHFLMYHRKNILAQPKFLTISLNQIHCVFLFNS